ncbi:hypothetical protein B0J13DRAFT_519991 [Dactylonectria estremocensis]|uniref:Chitinase n=1 Tax=Dactylonectria estremocensis TaxID=1079267 RepID=A0A9P9J9D4_9HYPO|nr:hypothetical protein B0J13DRAFT_519991 [Dactylonectria estremocensis]
MAGLFELISIISGAAAASDVAGLPDASTGAAEVGSVTTDTSAVSADGVATALSTWPSIVSRVPVFDMLVIHWSKYDSDNRASYGSVTVTGTVASRFYMFQFSLGAISNILSSNVTPALFAFNKSKVPTDLERFSPIVKRSRSKAIVFLATGGYGSTQGAGSRRCHQGARAQKLKLKVSSWAAIFASTPSRSPRSSLCRARLSPSADPDGLPSVVNAKSATEGVDPTENMILFFYRRDVAFYCDMPHPQTTDFKDIR